MYTRQNQSRKGLFIITAIVLSMIGIFLLYPYIQKQREQVENIQSTSEFTTTTLLSGSPTSSTKKRLPRNVFFDLGANKGDSLNSFVYGKEAAQGGDSLKGKGAQGEWDLWAFEGNSYFNKQLRELEQELKLIKLPNGNPKYNVVMKTEAVANAYDGKAEFYVDRVNEKHDFWGSSLMKEHRDAIASQHYKVQVDSYDIARLIRENYTKDDYVIVKADVEGAEYDLIARFLANGAAELIDVLAIEFHPLGGTPKLMENKCLENAMIWILQKAGVRVTEWG
jgi:FkbM family methyltransferase